MLYTVTRVYKADSAVELIRGSEEKGWSVRQILPIENGTKFIVVFEGDKHFAGTDEQFKRLRKKLLKEVSASDGDS